MYRFAPDFDDDSAPNRSTYTDSLPNTWLEYSVPNRCMFYPFLYLAAPSRYRFAVAPFLERFGGDLLNWITQWWFGADSLLHLFFNDFIMIG